MYNFFIEKQSQENGYYKIEGDNFNHIAMVLRMKVGERLLVSQDGKSNLCEIAEIFADHLTVRIIEENYLNSELPVDICLLQGLPKADKLELIIQKAVELGTTEILPVETARSVVRIEEKKKKQKTERWQAIAEAGAKQSKRNVVPKVHAPLSFKQVLPLLKDFDLLLVPYENKNGMADTISALKEIKVGQRIGVFIGPEGGFEQGEIDTLLTLSNTRIVSLGKRILRTETASITALSMLMLHVESSFVK